MLKTATQPLQPQCPCEGHPISSKPLPFPLPLPLPPQQKQKQKAEITTPFGCMCNQLQAFPAISF